MKGELNSCKGGGGGGREMEQKGREEARRTKGRRRGVEGVRGNPTWARSGGQKG